MEDIGSKIDPSQYGARKGTGTEHMIVAYVDRVLKLLDSERGKTAVIAAAADWAAAFDRIDPTTVTQKFLKMGLRPSLVQIFISYMTNRKMIVKFKDKYSKEHKLVGGGPQGTLLGGIEYIVAGNDCCLDDVAENNRYKYYDDLNIFEFVLLTNLLLQEYDCQTHVPSDIDVNLPYLPPDCYNMQSKLNHISEWTDKNMMSLNEDKCNYIIYSRLKTQFNTRLSMNNIPMERLKST